MRRQGKTFAYASLERAFADVGESLRDDLSAVRATLVRDVHFDDYELEVAIYGQDGATDDAPVVHQALTLSDGDLDGYRLKAGQGGVIGLFDRRVQDLMLERRIRIEWNPGESSAQLIDPAEVEGTIPLLAVDR